ncbi:Uncharacterised protein [Mycoplasmopsis californica]|uniref:Uncharacterized protein n=1 Tax=Mycoplasmopsis equigenitalium TaxID=114883 RepID=A0ABY5J171_9BACT|nr:hypothetical protein [Mycoplasmopsis equigenitalium]UUD37002.1 hypothetical protein NPA09_00265 [Mycoplasmopsis equigenitalium]VEU69700.1 Uncharacterised protein [Mycoplasmopsis californica]
MKKVIYIILTLLAFCAIGAVGYFTVGKNENIKKTKEEKQNIEIIIKGAVERPNMYLVKKGTSLREVLFMAKLRIDADLSQINMNTVLASDQTIVVPFKNESIEKIHIKDYIQIEQLTKHKIPKRIAQSILDLKNNKTKITWEDIDNLHGVGSAYLEKLKSILILDF